MSMNGLITVSLFAAMQEEIERGYLRRAMTLCQDTDYIVRINMCDGLHCLAAAVGLEVTVATILPEILELMKDEEPLVRVAAINSLVAGTRMMLQSTVMHAGVRSHACSQSCMHAVTITHSWLLLVLPLPLLLLLMLPLLLLIAKSARCHLTRLFSNQQWTK